MRTVHETVVRAPLSEVLAIASDVQRWPEMDPAYRWCRILERDTRRTVFEMAGVIRGWPARWTAVQERFPEDGRIVFRHTKGITTGMVVEWRITPVPEGVLVVLTHDLIMPWPVVGRALSDLIVGPVFINWIAARTLQGVKREVER